MSAGSYSVLRILAHRFLFSKHSDRFLSLITWVSVTGVALGVLALTTVTSVINGFSGELSNVITGVNGELILYSHSSPVNDVERYRQKIGELLPQAQAITASFVTELMVSGPAGVSGAIYEGVELDTYEHVLDIKRRVVEGHFPKEKNEIAIGKTLAETIGVKVGEPLRIIIPFAEGPIVSSHGDVSDPEAGETSGGGPKVLYATISGILQAGMHKYDSRSLFGRLEDVQEQLNQKGRVTAFKIKMKPGTDLAKASDRLKDHFGYPFRAKDWMQLNKNLFYAIQLEKVVISIILTTIILVAAFNVVSTLMMMSHDKSKEVAILKAMGLPGRSVFGLFCWIGMGIGLVGICLGIGAGLLVNQFIERTRWIKLPADIYYIGYLPVVENGREILLIAVFALVICFCATLYPAVQIMRRSPLEGLRYE